MTGQGRAGQGRVEGGGAPGSWVGVGVLGDWCWSACLRYCTGVGVKWWCCHSCVDVGDSSGTGTDGDVPGRIVALSGVAT